MNKVTLKEHLNSRIDEVKDSVNIAYASMEKRLESMNEFRNTLRDQASSFINRDTFEALQKQVNELKETGAELKGKASQESVNSLKTISVIGIVLAAISIIMKFI